MKRLLPFVISFALLALIYWRIDFRGMLGQFAAMNPWWLAAAFAILAPALLFTAWRLARMAPEEASLSLAESTRLTLAASVLNMFLPSKAGDLAKAWFFRQRGHLPGSLALSLVVFEKSCDMLALLAWCVFGLAVLDDRSLLHLVLTLCVAGGITLGLLMLGSLRFARFFFGVAARFAPGGLKPKLETLHESWGRMHAHFWADRRRLALLAALSLGTWCAHLVGVWMFIRSLGAGVPLLDSLALTPLAILAGLLPLTFAGIGARDAAIIFFYRAYLTAPEAAAVGIYLTARYAIFALAGLPFLGMMSQRGAADSPAERDC